MLERLIGAIVFWVGYKRDIMCLYFCLEEGKISLTLCVNVGIRVKILDRFMCVFCNMS